MFMQNAHAFRPAERIVLASMGLTAHPGFAARGMLAASLVETAAGWRRAGTVAEGDRVQTWDGGLVAVTGITRHHLPTGSGQNMILVPGGAFGACSDLWLMPRQEVLILSSVAEAVLDASGAFVAAEALVGHAGVRRMDRPQGADVISLTLASDEAVYVNSGVLVRGASSRKADWMPNLSGPRAQAYLSLATAGAHTTADLARAA